MSCAYHSHSWDVCEPRWASQPNQCIFHMFFQTPNSQNSSQDKTQTKILFAKRRRAQWWVPLWHWHWEIADHRISWVVSCRPSQSRSRDDESMKCKHSDVLCKFYVNNSWRGMCLYSEGVPEGSAYDVFMHFDIWFMWFSRWFVSASVFFSKCLAKDWTVFYRSLGARKSHSHRQAGEVAE